MSSSKPEGAQLFLKSKVLYAQDKTEFSLGKRLLMQTKQRVSTVTLGHKPDKTRVI